MHTKRELGTRLAYRLLLAFFAWEPLIPEREAKYVDLGLASDLTTQLVGWRVTIHPLVVGDLGSVTSIVKELKSTNLYWRKGRHIHCVGNCQFEVLCKTRSLEGSSAVERDLESRVLVLTRACCWHRCVGPSYTPVPATHTHVETKTACRPHCGHPIESLMAYEVICTAPMITGLRR